MSIDPETLRATTVFSPCSAAQVARLIEAGELTHHEAGDVLTEEGSMGHRFHLLLDGGAEVVRGGTVVSHVPAGQFLGEVGLLGGGPSTATVRCTEATRCLTVERERFWEVLEAEPALALRILEIVCRRLEEEIRAGTGGASAV